jgi:MFS superfamily sulfate permease-like transporter
MRKNDTKDMAARPKGRATGRRGHLAGAGNGMLGDVSGAFGDLGTFLPYVVVAIGAGLLAPAPVFAGFAAGYLLVAVVYRLPVAVQPMKAVGAVILAGGLSGGEVAWAGAMLGAILLALAASPLLLRAARVIPQSVVTGLQAGLGLVLLAVAARLMGADWLLALPALALLSLTWVWPRGPWALALVALALLFGPSLGAPLDMSLVGAAPEGHAASAWNAFVAGALPQLPLTLLNAVVVAAAVARTLYGAGARRVSERRLAATSGALNLLLAPFGAMPMCHGAGGIAGHHRLGARGIAAPLLLAALCAAAALSGDAVPALLARMPAAIVGALLAYAAVDLLASRRLVDARPDCRPVIAATAFATWGLGALAGLAAGLAAEAIRVRIRRREQVSATVGREMGP